jgi:uncharacterized cysteine cluster protein YcgN (CxxCxxCC family)
MNKKVVQIIEVDGCIHGLTADGSVLQLAYFAEKYEWHTLISGSKLPVTREELADRAKALKEFEDNQP